MPASSTGRQSALSFDTPDAGPSGNGTQPTPSSAPPPAAGRKAGPARGRSGRKSASAFRTISEVSQDLDVPQHVLRFWETKFSQLRPMKRGGGRRYYRPEDVHLLKEIKTLLHRDCYTIKGVQKLLKERRAGESIVDLSDPVEAPAGQAAAPAVPSGKEIDPALRETLSSLLGELRDLRKALSGNGQ